MATRHGLIWLLLLFTTARSSFEGYCSAQYQVLTCSTDTDGNNCHTTGYCCLRLTIGITTMGQTHSISSSTCAPCNYPVPTISFQRYVRSLGTLCDCAQVQTIPSYYLNGHLVQGMTIAYCNNMCCGDSSGSSQNSGGGGSGVAGSSQASITNIKIILGCVFGSLIVIITIGFLIHKYKQDPHFFDPIMHFFQHNQPEYHNRHTNRQNSTSAFPRPDQVPRNERPPEVQHPQALSISNQDPTLIYSVPSAIPHKQMPVVMQQFSLPIKKEEQDVSKGQLLVASAEKPSHDHESDDGPFQFISVPIEEPQIIKVNPKPDVVASPSLDDIIHQED